MEALSPPGCETRQNPPPQRAASRPASQRPAPLAPRPPSAPPPDVLCASRLFWDRALACPKPGMLGDHLTTWLRMGRDMAPFWYSSLVSRGNSGCKFWLHFVF